jgi:hypothetical protein
MANLDEQDNPVTVIVRGTIKAEYEAKLRTGPHTVASIDYGSGAALLVVTDAPSVEIRRDAEIPPGDAELLERAVRDALAFYESGYASLCCGPCMHYPPGVQCSEHDPHGTTVAAYRALLVRLTGQPGS